MRSAISLAIALAAALAAPSASRASGHVETGGLVALPAMTAGSNVVENPGFESPATGDAAPHWTLRPGGDLWKIDGTGHTGGASLRLSGADRTTYVATAEQTVTLERGYYTLEGWVKTADLAKDNKRAGVRLCLDGRPRVNWWKCTEPARGTADWKAFRRELIPVTDPSTYRVTFGAYGKPDGTAWFDDIAVARASAGDLEAFLLYPNFRGLLFDDRSQVVRVAVSVATNAPRDAHVRVTLVDETGGQVRQTREYPRPATTATPLVAELDAAPLAAGAYVVRTDLVDAAGKELARHPGYRIVKTPAKTREKLRVWYDEQNVTHLGGKPAFVLGLYNTSGYSTSRAAYATGRDGWGNNRIAQAPFNMLINYWLGTAPLNALSAYMDDLHARGITYLHTVNFYYADDPRFKTLEYPAARDGEDAMNRWIAKSLHGHPGLAGFYTADERTADMIPKVFRQHRQLAAGAPDSVDYVVLGNGWEQQAPLWRDALDVIGLDPYPITKPSDNDLAMVGEWTRLGKTAVMDSRPVWTVIQFFPLTRQGGWPTYEQLRAMSWMAIIDGAKGLFYWSFGARGLAWVKDPKEREQHWEDLVRVTKEIKALEPVLLAPDVTVAKSEASGPIRTLGKRMPDGTRYLFAYNATAASASARWPLSDAAREVATLAPSSGSPTLSDGVLTDAFQPYEVKLYRIR